jgi:predicted nucleic acid-binding protein
MRYVLDSCLALKWVLPEPDAAKAIRTRDEYHQGIHELLSPDVFPIEVAHSLAKSERRGLILPGEGLKMMNDVLNYMPDLHPYLPLLPRAFAIASAARIGVYDCLYIALAEREGCEVLTTDARLKNALPGSPVVLLSSLP